MYLDTDMFYSIIKYEDMHKEKAQKILAMREQKYTSIATIIELELVMKKEISDEASKTVIDLLKHFSSLKIIEVDEKTMNVSLELRKKHTIGIFDSVHAASALLHDKRIASTDAVYDRIPELKRII